MTLSLITVFVSGVSDKSDHNPLWLRLNEGDRRVRRRGFKFENSWLEEPELPLIVGESWSMNEGLDFLTKINHCTSSTCNGFGMKTKILASLTPWLV